MTSGRRVENRQAYFDYQILEEIEAGLALIGSEVKSFRAGQVSLSSAFVRPLQSGPKGTIELWLINSHFTGSPDPDRSRKLLVHRRELIRLIGKITEKGLTLIPLTMYIKGGRLKLSAALARGKKQFEKREKIRARDLKRELARSVSQKP